MDEAESGRRFINRGRLLHTLFSAIETEADIDDAVNRLVFEGIIGRAETEEEIRELTKAFAQPQIKGLVFGNLAVVQRDATSSGRGTERSATAAPTA